MNKRRFRFLALMLTLLLGITALFGCGRKQIEEAVVETIDVIESMEFEEGSDTGTDDQMLEDETGSPAGKIAEDGSYTDKDSVALYLYTYGHLPSNFISKNEAKDLGWENSKGNLDKVAPGMSIGGDKFGNREGLLPKKDGRKYYECDINFDGGYRGAERIIYSNDGLIYYTGDHYNTFTLLYGEE